MTDSSARISNHGTLYIVATPIGNLEDITLRALTTLRLVDAILAEDTRHSGSLLASIGIKKPLIALHMHNEAHKSQELVAALSQGKSFALISDAGTPLISDPGYPLVHLARSQGINVIPIPGPCALIAALSVAGIACDNFTFYGFLPAKSSARRTCLEGLVAHTCIFYESTHRIIACIEDIILTLGEDCLVVLAKELTKQFERMIRGTAIEIKEWLLSDLKHTKGEFIILLPPRYQQSTDNSDTILSVLLQELSVKQAVKLTSQITGQAKNYLYAKAIGK